MKANLKLISLSIATLCATVSLAHAEVQSQVNNDMYNESNIFVLGGTQLSLSNDDFIMYSPHQQMTLVPYGQTYSYQPLNFSTEANFNQSFGFVSLYGVNYINWHSEDNKFGNGTSEADDFGPAQFNLLANSTSGASFQVGGCDAGGGCLPLPQTVISRPSVQITEIKPDIQTTVNGQTYDDPPIYHIVITSGSFLQSANQNSTVAPAYYLDFNNGTPFNGSDIGGFAIEPAKITASAYDSNDYKLQLSPVDVYYHGNLPYLWLEQDFNDLLRMGPAAGNQPGATMTTLKAVLAGHSISMGSGSVPNAPLSIVINPGNQQNLPAVAANGMDQEAFTVQLSFTMKNGNIYNIPPTDPQYGWLYNDIYFLNADGTLINNLNLNGGGDSVSETEGPYQANISNGDTAVAAKAGQTAADSPSTPLVGPCSTDNCPNTYYFSSTQVGNFPIQAVINARGVSAMSGFVTFPAQAVIFAAQTWNPTGSTSNPTPILTYSQNLTPTPALPISSTSENEAAYLNLDNASLPVYVGFTGYEALSGDTYCADPESYSQPSLLNQTKYGVVQNSDQLAFPLGCPYDNTVPNITTNAIDQYGDYNVTVGYGD